MQLNIITFLLMNAAAAVSVSRTYFLERIET